MDVDFDTKSSFDPKTLFQCIRGSMIKDMEIIPHPVGYYFQNVPVDIQTGLSAIPYREAEALGYEKVDFLHLSLLDGLSYDQLELLRSTEPDWALLQQEAIVSQLFHLGTKDGAGKLKHFGTLLRIKPNNLEEVADVLALIRPSKHRLIEGYRNNIVYTRKQLYKEEGDYHFKRSHAFSYATNIAIQLNLLVFNFKINDNDFLQY